MQLISFFCPCFNGESQIRFSVRFSFRTELGSIGQRVLKDSDHHTKFLEKFGRRKSQRSMQFGCRIHPLNQQTRREFFVLSVRTAMIKSKLGIDLFALTSRLLLIHEGRQPAEMLRT